VPASIGFGLLNLIHYSRTSARSRQQIWISNFLIRPRAYIIVDSCDLFLLAGAVIMIRTLRERLLGFESTAASPLSPPTCTTSLEPKENTQTYLVLCVLNKSEDYKFAACQSLKSSPDWRNGDVQQRAIVVQHLDCPSHGYETKAATPTNMRSIRYG
jgi:hypothetical protein